jgi:hypothetical protein
VPTVRTYVFWIATSFDIIFFFHIVAAFLLLDIFLHASVYKFILQCVVGVSLTQKWAYEGIIDILMYCWKVAGLAQSYTGHVESLFRVQNLSNKLCIFLSFTLFPGCTKLLGVLFVDFKLFWNWRKKSCRLVQ